MFTTNVPFGYIGVKLKNPEIVSIKASQNIVTQLSKQECPHGKKKTSILKGLLSYLRPGRKPFFESSSKLPDYYRK